MNDDNTGPMPGQITGSPRPVDDALGSAPGRADDADITGGARQTDADLLGGPTEKAPWDQGTADTQTGVVTDDYADIMNPGTTTLDEVFAGTSGAGDD